eukprot:Seg2155.6 transcript_id=Seg2155.6/GoldUCD/mRNA.D3Y31 product="WD repeat-containing protein 54" protein_id=Seg2155.6/GoldUCD/D3Y31
MYKRSGTVQLRSSASILCNNLDVCKSPGKPADESKVAVIHKSVVWVFSPKDVLSKIQADGAVPFKQVFCKGESSQSCSVILQAKWCVLPQRTMLILASVRGMQMFEDDGSVMVFWQALAPNPVEGLAQYARGISVVGDEHICIGTADGNILVFLVPSRGPAVKLQETLDAHGCSISDIAADGQVMASSDESGKIIIWKAGGHFVKVKEIAGFGYPCSSLSVMKNLVIGAYGTGHIRIFNLETGSMLCEVSAHSRWINAIDVCKKNGMIVSASEDTHVKVWKLTASPFNFEFLFEDAVADVQLAGAKFLDDDGDSFAVTGYDSCDVVMYNK